MCLNIAFLSINNLLCHRDVLQYDDVTIPLALTDCDILNNKLPPQTVEGVSVVAYVMEFFTFIMQQHT